MRQPAVHLAAILALALGACAPQPSDPDETLADSVAEVEAVADALWDYFLEKDLSLRVTEGLPIESLPQLSLAETQADATHAAELLDRLDAVDLSALTHEDFLTARVVRRDLEFVIAFEASYWNELSLSPYISLYTWRRVGTVLATHPLTTPEGARRYSSLLGDYVRLLAQHLAKVESQAERGIWLPRAAIPGTIAMLEGFRDQFAAQRTLESERVETLDAASLADLEVELEGRADEIVAGYDALIELLSGEYSELAPETVGASQFEGGEAHYRRMARYFTTLDLEPEEIHELGLKRVGEISDAMREIREEVGFTGTREAFHDMLRTDPRFVASDAEEVEDRYRGHIALMEERIGDYFVALPEAPYDVRRLSPAEEVNSTFGYYKPPDSIEPTGYYNYNGSKLDERSQVTARSLIFHELLPGHHFQVALQYENDSLHPYRRYSYFGAFTEGWAEYASSLGEEMGLFEDPYDRYGRLIMEIFLATRLVVDTGMGTMGWSLEEARDYMRANVFQSETQIATETLRYATRPGQALAYRLGYEKIWELRRKAESELGDAFDIREFHAIVIGSGNLPMTVLAEHVDWWVDSLQRGAEEELGASREE